MHTLPQTDDWRQEARQFIIDRCIPFPAFLDTGDPIALDSDQCLKQRQRALFEQLLQLEPTILVTIRWAYRRGQPSSWPYKNGVSHASEFTKYKLAPSEVFDALQRIDKELTDRILGNKAYRLPESQRIEWWAAAEDASHVHMLIKQPPHGRRLVRYDYDGRGREVSGRDLGLTEYLTEMVRRLKIGKDAVADSIGPYQHLACAYLTKLAWKKRFADSNERDFTFHSSYVHRDRQKLN